MRTELDIYYKESGKKPRGFTLFQRLYARHINRLIKRADIGSEQWIELQNKLANRSASTFDCSLREQFYKHSCKSCGSDICVLPNVRICYAKNITLGDRVYINTNTLIVAKAEISIGNDVLIGPNTIINSGMHNYKDAHTAIGKQGHTHKPIIIEDDVWIGANVVIMPGVVLGKGCVVGANSFVNKSVEQYAVVAGSPAKKISARIK